MHGPRRMVGRDVQGAEVVEIVLDLRAFLDVEADAAKQRLNAGQGTRDRMQPARLLAAAWQGDVDPLGLQPGDQRRLTQHLLAGLGGGLDGGLGVVDRFAKLAPLLGRQLRQTA